MFKKLFKKILNKRFIVVVLLLFFAVNFYAIFNTFTEKTTSSVWDGSIAKKFKSGTGSVDDPYVIDNGSELAYFFTLINGEDSGDYFNKFYKITNNIDLNGREFSFSKFDKSFSGNLNGNGFTIFNFKVSDYSLDEETDTAHFNLFDTLNAANIRNINFSDVTFVVNAKKLINDRPEEVKTVEQIEEVKPVEQKEEVKEEIKVEEEKTEDKVVEEKTIEEVKEEVEKSIEETASTIKNYTVRFVNDDENNESNTDEEVTTTNDNNEVTTSNTEQTPSENTTNSSTNNQDQSDSTTQTEEPKKEDDKTENTISQDEENKTDEIKTEEDPDGEDTKNTEEETRAEEDKTQTEETPSETKEEAKEENKTYISNITISMFRNVKESRIANISLNNIKIEYSGDKSRTQASLFVLDDVEKNTFENINVNGTSELKTANVLIKNYNDSDVKNIIYRTDDLVLIENYQVTSEDSIYRYQIKDEKLIFFNDYGTKAIIDLLNSNSPLNWTLKNNTFKIENNGKDASPLKAPTLRRAAPASHASGRSGGTFYINDYESDWNYYQGLNYTTSTSGHTPTTANKNLYNENTLVYVQINYHANDIDNDNTGALSFSENDTQVTYYKVYPVNTTTNKVEFELIDNPFAKRPGTTVANTKTFNGWITNYQGATITLDMDLYVRNISVPVTYTSGVPNNIVLDVYAVWTKGKTVSYTGNWGTTFSGLDDSGFHAISENTVTYESVTPYYTRRTAYYGYGYPSGAVNNYGNSLSGRCNSYGGCPYYAHATGAYNPNTQYYKLTTEMEPYTIQSTTTYTSEVPVGSKIAGYFRYTRVPNNGSLVGYYNSDAEMLTSGTCNNNNGCYYYELIQYYDENNEPEKVVSGEIYYYLTTRDTNIIVLSRTASSAWSQDKPFTLTAQNGNDDYFSSVTLSVNGRTLNCYADTRIENVRVLSNVTPQSNATAPSGTAVLIGNNYNLKIGRHTEPNTTNRVTFRYIIGSTTDGVSSSYRERYRMIVESGLYNNLGVATRSGSGTTNYYIQGQGVFGNDFDRILEDDPTEDTSMEVRYDLYGAWGGNVRWNNENDVVIHSTVKSGAYGTNKFDAYCGMYVGGRGNGTHYATRVAVIEGGWIYNILGGPLSASSLATYNDIQIYMKGGSADIIIGGAGSTATYGNKVIQITGGQVNYSVFGGSNGVEGNDNDQKGTVDGDTFVYVGGNAIIGDSTLVSNNTMESHSECEAGSVFGIGNGRSGYNAIGTVNNSNVIIDGDATIRRNVYGGGNYGATGQNGSHKTYATNMFVHGGTIKGSLYGGGNNNGAGSTSNTTNINISMDGGTIEGSLYGGSRTKGIVYGSTTINVSAGQIDTDVYGGGEGGYTNNNNPGTFVRDDVDITIGTVGGNNNDLTISGSVYGGSAYGTVNATTYNANKNSKHVNVTVNSGKITNSVFGGAKGSSTITPYVKGNSTVDINGGIIGSVFGGFDVSGKPQGTAVVTIDGGQITSAYGGGNETSIDDTNISLRGGTVTTLYGGSNQDGTVLTTTVTISGGTAGTVYGGNNEGGSCGSSSISMSGGTINTAIYGGGNLVDTDTTSISVTGNSGTIPNIFGGGNKAGADETSITLNGSSVKATNVYGGSNQSGDVDESNILVSNAVITNLYGGNNAGGQTDDATITVNNGTITTIYGGGNEATTGETHVTINNGTITNLFGGGNKATTTTTNVVINNTTTGITNTYGGGNEAACTTTNVTINGNGGTFTNVYGGGNKAGATTTNVTTTSANVNVTNIFGGSNTSGTVGESHVTIENGTITTVYGSNNEGGSTTITNVTIESGTVTTAYGGGNKATSGTTHVSVEGGNITTVFGGGNEADVTTSNVTVLSANNTISAVYGGGNKAGATTTNVTIGTSSGNVRVTNAFGGSNQSGNVGTSNVTTNSANVSYLYGGNNAGGKTTNANVEVNGTTIVSLFGGGKEAATGNTDVTVNSGNITVAYGGGDAAGVDTNTSLEILGGSVANNVYGGGNEGTVGGNTDVQISNTNVYGSVFAGGNGNTAVVSGNTSVTISGTSTIGTTTCTNSYNCAVFGGGNAANVVGSTNVDILGGTVLKNVYGGGNEGTVGGNTDVLIHNTTINGSAYAGGNGNTAVVSGNTSITVSGTSTVGTSSCTNKSNCSVFGGGNAAATGIETNNNSVATVKITGATVYGNVYGGANTSKVFGETVVDIGADVQTGTNITRGPIDIKGTVFGGGEANAAGSTTFDFSFISVTQGVSININGLNYNTFSIGESIFGSGNASSSQGDSEVVIKNYGTPSDPQMNVSIQRANIVTLDNCNIVLQGATDRTNEWSDVLFSLSRVTELDMKNNTTIYMENGANLLETFKSLNSDGTYATVTIDEDGNITNKSTDNRLYIFAGRHLDIAKDQNATDMGEVYGMTFFGMYRYNQNDGGVNVGIYDDEETGDDVDWSKVIDNVTSYVAGLHKTAHNIKADGFYTNYPIEETSKIKVDYIEPTPPTGPLYMWIIGTGAIEYEENLVASRYSTLGSVELSLRDFTQPNTTFSILGFDYSELNQGVSLIDKTQVKKIADTSTEADNVMGISMETTNAGWLINAQTSFVTNPNDPVTGTTSYVGGNSAGAPSVLLYLHHSKNIATAGEMGKVRIQLMAIRQINALDKETKRLIITLNLSRTLYDTISYEGSMTAGRKYEMFASTATNITSSSSISAYYALFATDENIYKTGYHRTLVSTFVFPLNTKITMIDFSGSSPEYYYKVLNATDVQNAQTEFNQVGEVSYNVSMFEAMGAENSGVYYNDALKNVDYYSASPEYCEEEFIFIIDFGDTTMNTDHLQNKLLLEMRNSSDATIYSVLAPQHDNLTYNIYANRDAVIDMDGTISSNKIYAGDVFDVDLTIDYTQSTIGSTVIYDTHYFDSKLGIKISLINSDNNVVTGTTLLGLNYTIDEVRYDPNIDGTARIKIADKVDSAEKWIIIDTGTAAIATGHYKLRIESFGSPDGIYYGLNSSDMIEFNIEIVNEIYGLDVQTTPEEMIINKATGQNENKENSIGYTISYNSGLNNPNIRFKLYRRNYNSIDDTTYSLVDAADYFADELTASTITNEYIISSDPNEEFDVTFTTKDDLVSGTYKMEFELYDDTAKIGTVEKYFIIK